MVRSIHNSQVAAAPYLKAEAIARIKEVSAHVSKEELDAGCAKVFARSPIAIAELHVATEWRPSVSHTCFARNSQWAKLFGHDPVMAAYVANASHKYDFSDEATPTLLSCIVTIEENGKASFRRGPTWANSTHYCHTLRYIR